jgi:hypothetical protein
VRECHHDLAGESGIGHSLQLPGQERATGRRAQHLTR